MGILALSNAIDDMQYGFRAVVNNIPQVVYMMGGGAGLAGVLGITAVAVNVMMNRWGELQAIVGHTAPFEAARGVLETITQIFREATGAVKRYQDQTSALGAAFQRVMLQFGIVELMKQWDEATKAAERHATALEKIKDATEKVTSIKGDLASERGADFTKAIETSGGGPAVLKQMVDAAMNAGGFKGTPKEMAERRQQISDSIALTLKAGMEGKDTAADKSLPAEVRNRLDQLRATSETKRIAAGQHRGFEFMQEAVDEFSKAKSQKQEWEAEGVRYQRAFESGREAKEKTTSQQLAQSPLALAMLQGRKITSKDVEGIMRDSGVDIRRGGQRPAEVLKDLRKSQKEDIEKTMRETGATRAQATRMHEIELQQRLRPGQRQQSEMVGIADFWKKIQTGALDTNKIAEQQLRELQNIRRAIISRTGVAVASGPA